MKTDKRVSIIMPAYNTELYIASAIESVLHQTWKNWELIIIENASTDNTLKVIHQFTDSRINVIVSAIKGVSAARNIGLEQATGEYICFLDADDTLPEDSLETRATLLEQEKDITYVDGTVRTFDKSMTKLIRIWKPDFSGNPYLEMCLLNPRCYSAVTWMIRRSSLGSLRFDTSWSHLEDRIFFLQLSKSGHYKSIDSNTYDIRRRPKSLMTQNVPFEQSYARFLKYVEELKVLNHEQTLSEEKYFHRIFFRTYAKQFHVFRSLKHWISLLRLSVRT
jgi:glycosyltransferase involved in cell wall biosynthesis